MKFIDAIKKMIKTGNSGDFSVMSDKDVESVFPACFDAINEMGAQVGYTWSWTGDDDFSHIPMFKYSAWNAIRPVILAWIEENCPQAWFKPVYMTEEEQREIMHNKVMESIDLLDDDDFEADHLGFTSFGPDSDYKD